MNTITQNATYSIVAAMTILSLLFMGFFISEPSVSRAQVDTRSFTISQSITGENSFTVYPTAISMVGAIAGLTGGNATGSAGFVVTSNNSGGYRVEIDFDDNPGANAMYGNLTGSDSIQDFADNAGAPIFGFAEGASAQFGYTVVSSTTADTADAFKYTATTCSSGGATSPDGSCWKAPDTAAYEIVNRTSAAPTGASSTITFKVNVPSGASPTVVTDTYTATATLSLFLQ